MRFGDVRDWFYEKRYGMFVHWGLYAIPAWHEQLQWRGRVSRADYVKLAEQWNPVQFDPDAWLDLAEAAGMGYICLTTKHHDGFCLWDTRLTDFNTLNTPYGRDLVGQLAEACQRRNFPLCLYYSVADWHHPHYPNEGRHHELPGPEPGDEPDWERYLDFLRGQVRELCTQYGPIQGWWWDMNVPGHVDPSVNALIRELQPAAVINNRGFDEGDFGTPERDYDLGGEDAPALSRPTEACQSVGLESWGYRVDEHYYTDRHLQRSLAKYLAQGANYLLNVGPTAEGIIPLRSEAILRRLGAWFHTVREALLEAEPARGLVNNPAVLVTRRDQTLYVHLLRDPVTDGVKLAPLAVLPRSATLLNSGQPVACRVDLLPSEHATQRPCLHLQGLPVNERANEVLVVKLEFEELPETPGEVAALGESDLLRR
jgi:alpha-L-fucosidase